MDFDLSKAQKLLQQSARDFFARECKPDRVRELMASETAFDDGLWHAMAEQGWTGLIIPEEYGGLGLSLVDLIDRSGSQGQRKQYLEPISAGILKATVALLEETADWNPAVVQARAERDRNGFRLRGRKEFVTDASVADLIICVAQNNNGLVLLPIGKDSKGLEITATPGIDATRKLYSVEFDDVVVPESEALAFTNSALDTLQAATDAATIALCAEMLGTMQWTLETSVEYAKTRRQFDKPIGAYQAVQHQCADMLMMIEGARSAVYYAAWANEKSTLASGLAVSIAKAYCSDAAREVSNRGIQVHGGIGFTWEHNLHLYYKRAKSAEIMFGDANYHREEIARRVIDEAE